METFGVIILAAGASTRLGQPKQLLLYHDQTLLKHAVNAALQVVPLNTFVVLGANAHLLKNEVADLPVQVVDNTTWNEGMASSIHMGLAAMMRIKPAIDNAIFVVCDQPFVSASLLQDLIGMRKETSKHIIASSYNNTLGTPVLFNKKYFRELLQLPGAEGAKKLINKYPLDLSTVPFPMGHIDVDTYDDYQKLIDNSFVSP